MATVLHQSPQFFTTNPDLVAQAARTMITVDGEWTKTKEREISASFRNTRRWSSLMGDALRSQRSPR